MDAFDFKKGMIALTAMLLLFCLNFRANSQKYGNYPYANTLISENGNAPDGIQLAKVPENINGDNPDLNPVVDNVAKFTPEGILLTSAAQSQFGAVFLNTHHFTSQMGITVEFEYEMYDGKVAYGGKGDGICMFLFDASVKQPTIGVLGAGLGYAYNRSYLEMVRTGGSLINYAKYRRPGLSGAYLGVAFDSYGNFTPLRYQGDSRVNGIPFNVYSNTGGAFVEGSFGNKDHYGNQISLRGAKGKALTGAQGSATDTMPGLYDGYTGYPVLYTQGTLNDTTYELNDTGSYKFSIDKYKGNLFEIEGGKKQVQGPEDPAYRKATVELLPVAIDNSGSANPEKGFYVTVVLQHGMAVDTLINNYLYKSKIKYQENATNREPASTGTKRGLGIGDYHSEDDLPQKKPMVVDLDASIPDSLRIGFAASTGAATNSHLIKNLRVSLPRSAKANNDTAKIYQDERSTIFSPLLNDYGYSGPMRREQPKDSTEIDPATFRFIDDNNNAFGGDKSYTCTTNEGTWKYNAGRGEVTFVPNESFSTTAEIRYDVIGGKKTKEPYSDTAYRSLYATLVVNHSDEPAPPKPPKRTLTNRMVTIKVR